MLTNSANALKLQQKTMTMCVAIPQIMASRIWLLATSPMNAKLQQKEIFTMVEEKQKAFLDSISNINSQIMSSQTTLVNKWISNCQSFMLGHHNAFNNFDNDIDEEAIKIMDKGISPYATTVKVNQKRLNH
ncbi:hypothetical protein [Psychrobacter sp. P2G3]|uniref:hypothetical protein n=1 Tax=unclassified Psychrobacter TaxID=196806 RepID=UPI00078E84DC|nr:hypothetical protein [Psychrobacter sp. P2G3]AMN49685.1 hypothetical protein AK823_07180 [Psychrobacter sp. P2G3]